MDTEEQMPNKHLQGEFPRAETLFFFIHYRVLTQMHPSLVFDTVSLSFPNFYFICPLTCTPRYVRNDVIKALIIPQSMKIFLFLPISLRIIAKIFWGGFLPVTYPVTSPLTMAPIPPSVSPTWPISPSFLHYPQRRTFAHAIFSPPRLVNLFSSFAVIHPILPQQQLSGPPWPCQIPPCMISSPLGRLLCFIMTGLRISCPHLDQRDEGRKCLVLLTSWIPPDLIFKRSTTTPGPGIEPNKCCWMGEKEGEPEGILSPQKPSCAPLGHSGYYWFFR